MVDAIVAVRRILERVWIVPIDLLVIFSQLEQISPSDLIKPYCFLDQNVLDEAISCQHKNKMAAQLKVTENHAYRGHILTVNRLKARDILTRTWLDPNYFDPKKYDVSKSLGLFSPNWQNTTVDRSVRSDSNAFQNTFIVVSFRNRDDVITIIQPIVHFSHCHSVMMDADGGSLHSIVVIEWSSYHHSTALRRTSVILHLYSVVRDT